MSDDKKEEKTIDPQLEDKIEEPEKEPEPTVRKTVAEEVTEKAENRPSRKTFGEVWKERKSVWLPVLLGSLIIIVVVAILVNALSGGQPVSANIAQQVSATSTVETTAEPEPFDAEGTQSFTEWMAVANSQKDEGSLGMWQALADLHFDGDLDKAYAAVKYQVVKEGAEGLDYYVRTVPAGGLTITNTSPSGSSYALLPGRTLKAGDTYLVFDEDNPFLADGAANATSPTDEGKETAAVRIACGNPIKTTDDDDDEDGCGPGIPGADPRIPGTGIDVTQEPQANQEAAEASNPAPDYVDGTAEEIIADQEANSGTTEPTDYGAVSPDPPPVGDTPNQDDASDVTSGTVGW